MAQKPQKKLIKQLVLQHFEPRTAGRGPGVPGQGRGQRAGPRAAGAGVDGRRTHAGADGRRMHTAPAEQVAWRLAGGLIGVKGSQCVIVLAEATALRY